MNAKTFPLKGSFDQKIILVSALRYAWGRSTYVPSSTAKILAEHMDEIEPQCAFVLARDIRNYWCRDYDSEKYGVPKERGTCYDIDVQPFVDLLPRLDEVSRPVLDEYPPMTLPQPPAGYGSWGEVPEEVRYRWSVK